MSQRPAKKAATAPVRAAKTATAPALESTSAAGTAERDLAGGGTPLPATTRSRMERAFGQSFADVRVHTGATGAAVTARHGAEALTVGRSIAFAPGTFQPGTPRGDHLLAHELTHVVQQGGRGAAAQARSLHSVSSETAEVEAEQVAARVVQGLPAGVRAGSFAATTRQRIMRRARTLTSALPAMTATPVPGTTPSPARTGPLPALTTQVSPAGGRLAGLSQVTAPSPAELRDASPRGLRGAMAARADAAIARTPTPDQAQTAQADAAKSPASVMVAGASAGAGAAAEPADTRQDKTKGKDKKKGKKDKDKKDKDKKDKDKKEEAAGERAERAAAGGGGGGGRRRTRRFGQIAGDRGAQAADRALQRLERRADAQSHHEPAGQRVADARAAATPPPTEPMSRSQGVQVGVVAAQTPPPADPTAARTELDAAITAAAPANMEEMSNFDRSPAAGAIRQRLQSNIQGQVGGIQQTINQVNHPAPAGPPPAAVPQPPAEAAPRAAAPRSAAAVPPPVPDAAVDATEFRDDADSAFAEHEVSEQARANATDGPLREMHDQEQDIDRAVDTAGDRVRTQETEVRTEATDELQSADADAGAMMSATRERSESTVGAQQDRTRSGEATDRLSVTEQIEGLYRTTATNVNTQLTRLTETSTQRFDTDQAQFLEDFRRNTRADIERFKDDRYSTPVVGWGRWVKDRFVSINELKPVKDIYQRNRDAYIASIDGLINRITADADATALACRMMITVARVSIDALVAAQPPRLRQEAEAAQQRVQQQFSQLERQIEQTTQQVRQTLQSRRQRAIQAVDQALAEIQAENEALLDKLVNFVKAIADALGKFFRLMNKISEMGVGTFISAAMSQAVDGIRNHLWDQLKEVFQEWLMQKLSFLQALLNLPANFMEVLLQAAMNMMGLFIESLPEALPGIAVAAMTWLATSLAAKLIPGVGALMAIIDGIRAAWSLIQSLIQAASAFFEFLITVASAGNGAVIFARALAWGIMAALDALLTFLGIDRLFQRVARPIARPMGRILGRLGARFRRGGRGGGGRRGAGGRRRRRDADGDGGRRRDDGDGRRRRDDGDGRRRRDDGDGRRRRRDADGDGPSRRRAPAAAGPRRGRDARRGRRDADTRRRDQRRPQDRRRRDEQRRRQERERRNRERLERARRELTPRIDAMLAGGVGRLRLRATLAFWRLRYRLRVLEARGTARQVRVVAANSPIVDLAAGYQFPQAELLRMLERIATDIWNRHFRTRAQRGATQEGREQAARNREASQGDLNRMSGDAARQGARGEGGTYLPSRPSDDLRLAAAHRTRTTQDVVHSAGPGAVGPSVQAQTRQQAGGGRFTESVNPATGATFGGLDYDTIVARLRGAGHSPVAIARAMRSLQTGGGIAPAFQGQANELALLRTLMFNVEVQRDRRNLVFSAMGIDAMRQGQSVDSVLSRAPGQGMHPATPRSAAVGFTRDGAVVNPRSFAMAGGAEGVQRARDENRRRQIELLKTWFRGQVAAGNEPVGKTIADVEQFVRQWVERYYGLAVRE